MKEMDTAREKLEEEWKQRCYKELNETPQTREAGLSAMRRYLNEKPEMKIVHSDEFLLRFLRARKFDSEKAFKLLENYFEAKRRDPELFLMAPALKDVVHLGKGWQCILKGRTKKGEAIFLSRPGRYSLISNASKRGHRAAVTVEEAFRTNVLAVEWALLEELTQLAGLVAVIDLSGFSVVTHSLFLSPYHSMRTTSVVQETMPLRFGGFHIVNQPRYIDAIYALFKPFLKDKVRDRVHFHGRSFDRLHDYISPDVLPLEYGGTCGSTDEDDWKERLFAKADKILEFEPPQ